LKLKINGNYFPIARLPMVSNMVWAVNG